MKNFVTHRVVPAALFLVITLVIWVAFAGSPGGDPQASSSVFRHAQVTDGNPAAMDALAPAALPLLITTEDELVGEPKAIERGEGEGGATLIARWPGNQPTGEIHLGLVALVDESEASHGSEGVRLQLGPYAEVLLQADNAIPAHMTGPRERSWSGVPVGSWQVVTLPTSDVAISSASPIHIRGEETRVVELELVPTGEIFVRVELATDDPVTGASVRVVGPLPPGLNFATSCTNELSNTMEWRGTTDADGLFRVSGLAPGAWFGVHAWTSEGTRATGQIQSMAPAKKPARLVATPAAKILVRTVDSESGLPISGLEVFVTDNRLQELSGARHRGNVEELRMAGPTDALGTTELNCEPGTWVFTGGDDKGYGLTTLQITESVIAAGQITVRLDTIGNDTLRVITADGRPVPNAEVSGTWWSFSESGGRAGELNSVTTDGRGEIAVEALGDLPTSSPSGLNLYARHPSAGSGGLGIDPADLPPRADPDSGRIPLPREIIVRPSGSLELHFAPLGWPIPRPPMGSGTWSTERLDEAEEMARALRLTLRFLGTPAVQRSWSAHHGETRGVLVGQADDDGTVRFEDLEPGCYAVAVSSRGRDLSFTTPPLWVRESETTSYWVEAPRAQQFGTVTLDIADAGVLWDATESPSSATLMAQKSVVHLDSSYLLQPSIAGEAEARRLPVSPGGRVVFGFVAPGRYSIGLLLPDAASPTGELVFRTTDMFEVAPGEEIFLSTLTAVPTPAGSAASFTGDRKPNR